MYTRRTAVGAVALTLMAAKLTTADAQAPAAARNPGAPPPSPPPQPLTPDALEVLELDKQCELAIPKMDVAFLDKAWTDDMTFTHGSDWTNHNVVGHLNTKEQWLGAIKNSNGQYVWKQANCQRIRMHGPELAIVDGRSSGHLKNATKDYEIWYARVYQKRDGRWQLASHQTVAGPQDATDPPVVR
jgi:Domain of unknown function (DUF4440)